MSKALGDDAVFKAKKLEIKQKLKSIFGVMVDMPKPGGSGNTNDGNTARKLFQNSALFAEATGVSSDLIHRLHILLCIINCNLQIDADKFASYCHDTAKLWVNLYPWYKIPVSLHVLLIHGATYLKTIDMPISFMTEQCIESGNKISKNARLNHTRKTSRLDTMTDHFNYLTDVSDPVIAIKIMKNRQSQARTQKTINLPDDALDLLVLPVPPTSDDCSIGD